MASQEFSQIGAYWEKNNQNEIDIVAVNELEKTILIAEVKRQASKINLNLLEQKSQKIRQKMSNYKIKFQGFSLEDLEIT